MRGLDTLWQDAVFEARLLRKSPIFAAAAVLTIALGVGVNTAVFSVVSAVVLRPLPVTDGARLVVIATQEAPDARLRGVSFRDLQDFRAASPDVFEDIAGYSVGFLGLSAEKGPAERVLVTWVTGNYFPLLELRPATGRLIRTDEGGPGRVDAITVLGYSTWQHRFGGDPSVVGRIVKVNGRPCTIAGVVPRSFLGTFAFSESELYLPLNWAGTADFESRQSRGLHAIARLRPRVTIERAQALMNVAAKRLARQYPSSNRNVTARVLPERLARPEEDQFRSNARGAVIMLALVALVMVVAAVNAINLLLSRGAARRQELAIRAALGAGRGRLVRQMVTASLLLAALGGCVGVLLGMWAAQGLATMRLPGDLPVRFDFQLDGRVLAYSSSITVLTGLLVGLVPALRTSSVDPDRTLRQSRYGSPGIRGYRIGGCLVVAQIAVCFVLLVAAGLFVRSAFAAEHADLGLRPDRVLNVHMDVGQLGYTEDQGRAFFDDVDRRVRSIPGVEDLSFAFTVPMGYVRVSVGVEPEGTPIPGERVSAGKNVVGAKYFHTMGIQIVRGRSFSDGDTEQSRRVAIVNQNLANKLFPGHDAIGRRIRLGGPGAPWVEVVGVTSTGKYGFLFEEPQSYLYVPIAQEYTGLRVLHVRTSMRPEALAPAVEQGIHAREPSLPLYDVQSMSQALGSGLGLYPVRVGAVSAAVLGLLAFALAMIGLYGVISFLASQRTHEIGVRLAVGATRQDIVRLIVRDGVNLVALGLAVGVLISLAGSGFVEGLLFGISPRDPVTFTSIAPVLGGVALIACAIPAWRAARLDPAMVLRAE